MMAQQTPTMQSWTDAWMKAEATSFKAVYAKNAILFPPKKPTVHGNDNVLEFMKGGLGKVAVLFEPTTLVMSEKLAYEQGVFKDVDLLTKKTLGQGTYAVTWILEDGLWKIQCHTWSMPSKS